MKQIKVGIISGTEVLLNRKGKVTKADPMVQRGCGTHVPVKHKEKTKQKIKNDIRRYY